VTEAHYSSAARMESHVRHALQSWADDLQVIGVGSRKDNVLELKRPSRPPLYCYFTTKLACCIGFVSFVDVSVTLANTMLRKAVTMIADVIRKA
jgi:hypothetical protein